MHWLKRKFPLNLQYLNGHLQNLSNGIVHLSLETGKSFFFIKRRIKSMPGRQRLDSFYALIFFSYVIDYLKKHVIPCCEASQLLLFRNFNMKMISRSETLTTIYIGLLFLFYMMKTNEADCEHYAMFNQENK